MTAETANAEMNGAIARRDDGTLWAAWTPRVNGSHDGAYFSRSSDSGATWSAAALVADAAPGNSTTATQHPALERAANGDLLLVAPGATQDTVVVS